jgi:hypothetical protein
LLIPQEKRRLRAPFFCRDAEPKPMTPFSFRHPDRRHKSLKPLRSPSLAKPFRFIAAVAIGAFVAAAAPAAMSVADFLGTVDGLKAKGPFALFSPDIGKLKREGKAAVVAFYGQAAPAGGPRNACPPPQDKFDMSNDEFMGMLKAVPVPQRPSTSVAQAVTTGLNRRYACGA